MNTKTTPKDFFLHVGATIALYTSVIAFINLTFALINKLLPDKLSIYFSVSSVFWPVSILIVLIPVLYILEWLIARDISKMVEKKDIWIRKWRIYLTLFLTGATIVGDFVALLNVYLNGEITSRFIWKIIIVLVICAAVFKYYYFSINEHSRWTHIVKKTVPWWGIGLVVAVIIGGFIVVGSPAKQRAIRFDEQRVSDLSNIQWQIINYWQKKNSLPQNLSDLDDPISNFTVPVDPETGSQYTYSIKGVMGIKGSPSGLSFELCAKFSTDTSNTPNDSWKHTAGESCFSRMIDSLLYPPVNTK